MTKSIVLASLFDSSNVEHLGRIISTVGDPNGQHDGWMGMFAVDIGNANTGKLWTKSTGTRAVLTNTGWKKFSLFEEITLQNAYDNSNPPNIFLVLGKLINIHDPILPTTKTILSGGGVIVSNGLVPTINSVMTTTNFYTQDNNDLSYANLSTGNILIRPFLNGSLRELKINFFNGDPSGGVAGGKGHFLCDFNTGYFYTKLSGDFGSFNTINWSKILDNISNETITGQKTFTALTTVNNTLDVNTTTGTLRVPRMTTAQRDLLTPQTGDVIFNTTLIKFQGYTGIGWDNLN